MKIEIVVERKHVTLVSGLLAALLVVASINLIQAVNEPAVPNPGHPASQIGPGIFNGTSTDVWSFPGKVGIGVTSPTKKLEVVGDINATGTIYEGEASLLAKYQEDLLTNDCGAGNYIRGVADNGTVTCEADKIGWDPGKIFKEWECEYVDTCIHISSDECVLKETTCAEECEKRGYHACVEAHTTCTAGGTPHPCDKAMCGNCCPTYPDTGWHFEYCKCRKYTECVPKFKYS
jgi:hypothetical protein